MGKSVLFVCTANICRSPMAAALFMRKIQEAARSEPGFDCDWRVESAGTWAREGDPAAPFSQKVMANRGIELLGHRSRIVTAELLESFHLILTMESGHKEALTVEFPNLANRIYMVSEMAGAAYDIRDPIAGTMVDYEETARELDRILTRGLYKIAQLAQAA